MHKNTEKESLTMIHNDILNQLTIARVNLRFFERQELTAGIDAEFTKNITHWRTLVGKLQASLDIISLMIEEYEKINSVSGNKSSNLN